MFIAITKLGAPDLVIVYLSVIGLYFWRQRWAYIATWVITLTGGGLLDTFLKHLIRRPRPVFSEPLFHAGGYSFPSGHAMLSFVAFGLFTYFAVLELKSWNARSGVICLSTVLVLLIGFSRMYLGVHYFSDVVGGFAAGGVWLATCITGLELVRRDEIRLQIFSKI